MALDFSVAVVEDSGLTFTDLGGKMVYNWLENFKCKKLFQSCKSSQIYPHLLSFQKLFDTQVKKPEEGDLGQDGTE